jgi:hypothetical protein
MNFHNFQTTRGMSGGNGRIKTSVGQTQRQRPNQAGSRQTNLQRQHDINDELLYDINPQESKYHGDGSYLYRVIRPHYFKELLDTQPLSLLDLNPFGNKNLFFIPKNRNSC